MHQEGLNSNSLNHSSVYQPWEGLALNSLVSLGLLGKCHKLYFIFFSLARSSLEFCLMAGMACLQANLADEDAGEGGGGEVSIKASTVMQPKDH